jgi:hypothetical protein
MDPREFSHANRRRSAALPEVDGDGQDYRVAITFKVRDVRSLWAAAAAKALAVGLMTLEDVEATLGPSEDPCVEDCIAFLTQPAPIPGCTLTAFDVAPLSKDLGLGTAIAA